MKNLSLVVVVVCILLSVTDADVSHLVQYLPPSHHQQASAPASQSLFSSPAQSFQYHSAPSQLLGASVPAASSHSHGHAFVPAQAQAYNFASFASHPVSTYSASASAPVQSYNFAASAPSQSQSYGTDSSAHVASYDAAASAPAQSYNFVGLNSVDHYNAGASDLSSFASSNVGASLSGSNDVHNYNLAASTSGSDASYSVDASVPVSVASSTSDVASYHSYNAEASSLAAADSSHQSQESLHETDNPASVGVGDTSASEPLPAHTFSAVDGYHYKTPQSVVHRRRRDVSHLLASEYLPPTYQSASSLQFESSAPAADYKSASLEQLAYSLPETHYGSAASVSAPQFSAAEYESAPEQQIDYQESASSDVAPAHTFSSSEGYRYKTNRRRVIRRHRY